jgi:FAD:protein FMN transferase
MRRKHHTALILCLAVLLASCGEEEERAFTFTRFAMDTVVEYTIVAESREVARDAMLAAHAEVERVAALLWEQESASQIYLLNHSSGPLALDPEVYGFLVRARDFTHATGGAFDVTIKPVLELYDFTAESSGPPADAHLATRLADVGIDRLRFGPSYTVGRQGSARVAVGGVAKGYAVDRAVEVLRGMGIENALVNAGGDLYAMGLREGRPWRVGVRHPDDPEHLVEVIEVSNAAVATSGDYQRYLVHDGVRYHHLLDPSTGRPARHVRSATVVAATAEEADALSTGLFVAGDEAGFAFLSQVPSAWGLVIRHDGSVTRGGQR